MVDISITEKRNEKDGKDMKDNKLTACSKCKFFGYQGTWFDEKYGCLAIAKKEFDPVEGKYDYKMEIDSHLRNKGDCPDFEPIIRWRQKKVRTSSIPR